MIYRVIEYVLFVGVAIGVSLLVPRRHGWAVWVALGLGLLSWAGPLHALFAIGLTLATWAAGLGIARYEDRRPAQLLVTLAILVDVGALCYFKYAPAIWSRAPSLLPIGISYYVFQLVGYALEVYWGRQEVERHPGRLAAAVLFFPKLFAGPIERPHHFTAQLESARPTRDNFVAGLRTVGWGVFKKCVIADWIKLLIDPIFAAPDHYAGVPLLLSIFAYSVEVYADFSGYTDIALGTARMLGFELMPNFNRPFSSRSVSELWRRWHISLSSWTNDYIYQPLSLSARGWSGTPIAAALVTFVVLGLWHGPRATYAMFGLLHGSAVAIESLVQRARRKRDRKAEPMLPGRLANVLTVSFYAFTCVFFRAESVRDATRIIDRAFAGLKHPLASAALLLQPMQQRLRLFMCVGLVGATLVGLFIARSDSTRLRWIRWPLSVAVGMAILLLGVFEAEKFLYEQF